MTPPPAVTKSPDQDSAEEAWLMVANAGKSVCSAWLLPVVLAPCGSSYLQYVQYA